MQFYDYKSGPPAEQPDYTQLKPGQKYDLVQRKVVEVDAVASITEQAIPGGWSDREVVVGPHTFKLFTPTDPDELLNHLESPEATTQPHLADPYWAKLWPAAPLLAEAIVRQRPSPKCNVLGARLRERPRRHRCSGQRLLDVTFSDYVPFAVDLALENAARNGFPHARGLVLDWRQPREEQISLDRRRRCDL